MFDQSLFISFLTLHLESLLIFLIYCVSLSVFIIKMYKENQMNDLPQGIRIPISLRPVSAPQATSSFIPE